MNKLFLLTILTLFSDITFGQISDSLKIKKEKFKNYEELKDKHQKAKIDTLTYVDSTFKFQVIVPKWLDLKETGTAYAWGGTLPPIKNIKNAILIKSFDKNKFSTLIEFKKFVIEDTGFGQTANWSNQHRFMGKKELDSFKNIGQTYKAYWQLRGLIYHCEYVLLETATAYIWIDFTSTEETFDINITKFEEFMSGFKIIN